MTDLDQTDLAQTDLAQTDTGASTRDTHAVPTTGASALGTAPPAAIAQMVAEQLERDKAVRSVLRGARRLLPSACRVVDTEVARALASTLDVDVVSRMVDTWSKYRAVSQACTRTSGQPRAVEVVPLHRRRGTLTFHPSVVLHADPVHHTFVFDLVIATEVVGLAAVVEAGHVRAFEGGRCTATATLSLARSTLATWALEPDVNVVVRVPGQRRPTSPGDEA